MIYLKTNNNKGYYRIDGTQENWIELDQINKDHMLRLLDLAVNEDFEMEEYITESLQNPAHNIIYKNIFTKFKELLDSKTRFQDTAESTYKAAIEKYNLRSA